MLANRDLAAGATGPLVAGKIDRNIILTEELDFAAPAAAHNAVGPLAQARRAIGPRLRLTELAQLAGPLAHHRRRHLLGESRRGRARPLAVRKHMEVGEWQRVDERERGAGVRGGLAREPGN